MIRLIAIFLLWLIAMERVTAHAAIPGGDADADGVVSPDDLDALASELFDGDGDAAAEVTGGAFAGGPGADGNDDGRVTVADFTLMPNFLMAPFWQALRDLPAARQETGTAALDGRVYVLGGLDALTGTVDTVEYYDVAADTWTEVASLPEPLHHIVTASVGGRIYALGGLRAGFAADESVYAYDPVANRWDPRASLLQPRGAGAAAVIDGLIYVAGGLRNVSVDDFAVYDPVANTWTSLPPMPTARDHLGAAAVNGIFYAIGGRAGGLYDVVEAYDPAANEWRTDFARMPTARGGLAVAALRGCIVAIGGEGNGGDPFGIFPQAEIYDPAADTWDSRPDMRTPRHGMGAVAVRGRIIVPGGARRQGFGASTANEALWP